MISNSFITSTPSLNHTVAIMPRVFLAPWCTVPTLWNIIPSNSRTWTPTITLRHKCTLHPSPIQ